MQVHQANRVGRPVTPEERALKAKARELGLKFHPRSGATKLRQMIQEHLTQEAAKQPQGAFDSAIADMPLSDSAMAQNGAQMPTGDAGGVQLKPGEKLFYTQKEWREKELRENKHNAGRLVRIRLTCMNPNKKNWTGEIISAGSAKVGTFKKFIPFNSEEPYHVPWILYQELKDRKCRIGTTVKLPNGMEVNRNKLINEFAIEILPPLTKQELEELKQRQAMAAG